MWSTLGTLNLTYEWQTFSTPVVNSELFKVIQPYNLPISGCVYLAPYYPLDGRGRSRKIYPSNDNLILTFPIPEDYAERGLTTFYLMAKRSSRARIFSGYDWAIEIQVFY